MGVKLFNAQKIWTNVGNGRMAKNGLMIRKQNSLVLINYLPMSNFLSNDNTSIFP